ncbi:MAG: hypothetical protein HYY03_06045 [Chloroflexi bacterium]|nr:hypothetical protein [Chloroflexota bacterium]
MGPPSPFLQPSSSPMRISLAGFPERYGLPPRPTAAPAAVLDAHRQAHFLLGQELALFEQAMNLQIDIVAANTKSASVRSPQGAALLGLWSRVFSYLADACGLMCRGSYASCLPLLRTACDCIAAQRSLLADQFGDYLEWLPIAFGQERRQAALSIELGRFRAGSVLAQDERLGAVYRFLTDLSMPHFGATALQTAPDSNLQSLRLAFADSAFHLGWAELVLGWLLSLAGAQLETATGSQVFAIDDDARSAYQRLELDLRAAAGNPRRCHAEELPDGRRLLHNFRRAASGVPRRLLLG